MNVLDTPLMVSTCDPDYVGNGCQDTDYFTSKTVHSDSGDENCEQVIVSSSLKGKVHSNLTILSLYLVTEHLGYILSRSMLIKFWPRHSYSS